MINTHVALPEMVLIGMSVRTSYEHEMNWKQGRIFQCVQEYFHSNATERIPFKKRPGTTICAYTDYESDYRGAYTYFIGEEVTSAPEPIIPGLSRLTVPSQRYAKFTTSPAPMPDVIINSWKEIWEMSPDRMGGNRRYHTDFEVYDERAVDHSNIVLDILIGLLPS